MFGSKERIDVKLLRTLEPLNSLSLDKLEELAQKSSQEELPPGRVIFRQGEKDSRCVYLVAGQLELQLTGNPKGEVVKAKTVEAKYPIAHQFPRPSTAKTRTTCTVLYVDSDLLEILLDDNPTGQYEVTEIDVEDDTNDWMLRFLQSPAFLHLPTDNIQTLLMRLEEVSFKKGETVVKQGDADDYYYIVKAGKCSVSRRPAPGAEDVRLAILTPGDGFGEEAIITRGKRNATVTMQENGVLMRLSKEDFEDLLVTPLIRAVDHKTMMDKVKTGDYLIDVRSHKEFTDNGIAGATNIPLSMMRVKAKELNPTREHIIYCNDGLQSSAAAFLLSQHGLKSVILEGGLNAQSKPFSADTQTEATTTLSSQTATTTKAASAKPVISRPPVTTPAAAPSSVEFKAHQKKAQLEAQRAKKAEQAREAAEAKSSQLRDKADALRHQAENLAKKTAFAEEQRRQAEAEIARDKEIAKQAKTELNSLRNEAEEARKRAEAELQRAQKESEKVQKRQAAIEAEYQRAQASTQAATKQVEEARRQAKLEAERVKTEAEVIRQQAIAEAESLRREMKASQRAMEAKAAKLKEQENSKRTKELETARKRAEEAINQAASAAEEARRQAQLEAETIRQQAKLEAEQLRQQLEQERKQAEEKAVRAKAEEQLRHQKIVEAARERAIEEARRQAELEAEAIRREALEEAQRLRDEMHQTRQILETEAARAQEQARQIAELEAQRKAAQAAESRAMDEAEQMAEQARMEAESHARRLAEEAEAEARRQAEEAEARRLSELERQRQADEATARQQAEQQARTEAQARKMAQSIKTRLEAASTNAYTDDFLETGSGISLAKAKLRKVKNKTILEGEEDIFIFKAPSEKPPSRQAAAKMLKQCEARSAEAIRNELPSFELDEPEEANINKPAEKASEPAMEEGFVALLDDDEVEAVPSSVDAPQTSQSQPTNDFTILPELHAPAQFSTKRNSKVRLYALAASIFLMLGISIMAITQPEYLSLDKMMAMTDSEQTDDAKTTVATKKPAHQVASGAGRLDKNSAEDEIKNEAEREFRRMLERWREKQQGVKNSAK